MKKFCLCLLITFTIVLIGCGEVPTELETTTENITSVEAEVITLPELTVCPETDNPLEPEITTDVFFTNETPPQETTNVESSTVELEDTPQDSIFVVTNGKITGLTDYGKSLKDIVIPESVNNENITAIGSRAFYGCNTLENVVISDSVVCIGSSAFGYCSSLKSVVIGENVSYIEDYAFKDCRVLSTIFFNAKNCEDFNGQHNHENRIFEGAGRNGEGVSLFIGENVERIPARMFYPFVKEEWVNITSVVFHEKSNCKTIGDYAFYMCHNLFSVSLGSNLLSIGQDAFTDCSLQNVSIPDSVTIIKDQAFAGCKYLKYVTIGNSVSLIEARAFLNCHSLIDVRLPDPDQWSYANSPNSTSSTNFSGLSDPSIAATYLSSTYAWYYWKRS